MSLTQLLVRFLVGGGLVVGISLLAEHGETDLAGIFVFFPAVTVSSYFVVRNTLSRAEFVEMVRYSSLGIIPLILFLTGLYVSIGKANMDVLPSLGVALVFWVFGTAILVNHPTV